MKLHVLSISYKNDHRTCENTVHYIENIDIAKNITSNITGITTTIMSTHLKLS